MSEQLSSKLSEKGLVRNIALDVPDFASVFRFMRTAELVAFMPAKLVASAGFKLKTLRVDLEIPAARVFALWNARFDRDPRHLWLRGLVREAAHSLAQTGAARSERRS